LTPAQLEELVAALKAERARLWARGEVDVRDKAASRGDLQDRAAVEVQARDRLALSDRDQARLAEVEAALLRVEQGTYAECEETGEPIPFARLQAEPTTRYTVEALEILEDEAARERTRSHAGDDSAY
jgi:DnaK suppressor protein